MRSAGTHLAGAWRGSSGTQRFPLPGSRASLSLAWSGVGGVRAAGAAPPPTPPGHAPSPPPPPRGSRRRKVPEGRAPWRSRGEASRRPWDTEPWQGCCGRRPVSGGGRRDRAPMAGQVGAPGRGPRREVRSLLGPWCWEPAGRAGAPEVRGAGPAGVGGPADAWAARGPSGPGRRQCARGWGAGSGGRTGSRRREPAGGAGPGWRTAAAELGASGGSGKLRGGAVLSLTALRHAHRLFVFTVSPGKPGW